MQAEDGLEEHEPLTAGELAIIEAFQSSGFYDSWNSEENAPPTTSLTAEPTGGRLSKSTTPSASTTVTIPSAATSVEPIGEPEKAREREAGARMDEKAQEQDGSQGLEPVGACLPPQVVLHGGCELSALNGNMPLPESTTATFSTGIETIQDVGTGDVVAIQERGQNQEDPAFSGLDNDL